MGQEPPSSRNDDRENDSEPKQDDIVFLTLEQVEAIHQDQLDRHGGREGYRDKGLIESAIDAPKQAMFGSALYPDIADKASVYLFQISESQGFTDGNKRTAVVACFTFLALNGYVLDCPDLELYDVTMRMANKLTDREEVASWIRERIVAAT